MFGSSSSISMGSSQSTTVETPTSNTIDSSISNESSPPAKTSNKPKKTGIALVEHRCRKKKAAYDKCHSSWYNDRFLKMKSIDQAEDCGDLFEAWRQCYLKNMKKEFFDKEKKQVSENSLLGQELDED